MPRIQRLAASIVALAVAGLAASAPAATYTINKPHTMSTFRIRHWVSNVEGRFDGIDGLIRYDPKTPAASSVEMTVDAKSVNTNNQSRDNDLRSDHFFDTERCPTLTFKSTKVVAKDPSHLDVTGDLTMRCVTKQVTVPVEFLGLQKMKEGAEKAGFETSFTVDRKDYGIVWNQTLDNGGVMLGDDVKITISVEADLQKEAPAAK
jgi:polyisoprenoid-binding protein YceI